MAQQMAYRSRSDGRTVSDAREARALRAAARVERWPDADAYAADQREAAGRLGTPR